MRNKILFGLLILNWAILMYSLALASIKDKGNKGAFDGKPDWIRLRNIRQAILFGDQDVEKLRKFLEIPGKVFFASLLFWLFICLCFEIGG